MGRPDQPRDKNGRWIARGSVGAVAIVAISGVGFSGGLGGGAAGGGGAASGSGSVAGQTVRVKLNNGRDAARQGKRGDAWQRMGLRQLKQRAEQGLGCAANSYGEVQRFFVRNPCRSLDRMLFVLSDGEGGSLILSVSWVRMPSVQGADSLKALADTDGTGNVSPMAGALLQAGAPKFTGRYYGSEPKGQLVVIAEAEPLTGTPDPEFLDGVAEVAAHLPRP